MKFTLIQVFACVRSVQVTFFQAELVRLITDASVAERKGAHFPSMIREVVDLMGASLREGGRGNANALPLRT